MRSSTRRTTWFASSALLALWLGAGCSSETTRSVDAQVEPAGNADASDAAAAGNTPLAAAPEAPVDAPLLEPFDPPPLAEIEAQADWQDNPVLDLVEKLREYQATQQPLVTVPEALALRNDSADANMKILSALGRLPANDAEANYDAEINRHLLGDIKSANPILQSSVEEVDVIGLTGVGLFTFDWDMNPCAAAETVKSWQTSVDRMYDKVVMRDDLRWSDGRPITAHDVVFSFQTILDPEIPVPAVRNGTDRIRWVQAYDDYTLVYFHKEPLATNVWNLNFPIIPKHIYEASIPEDKSLVTSARHAELENNPVIGGAYQIVRRQRQSEIVLERREDYYLRDGRQVRPKPYFKTIRFRIIPDRNTALLALKGGTIDELNLSNDQWKSQTGGSDFYDRATKVSAVEWLYFYFGWNIKRPWFTDKRVREAMSYAFDHKEMLDKLLYGLAEPCAGIFYHDAWMAPQTPTQPYQQDLDKAEALLAEAGWEDHDGDGVLDKEINGRTIRFEFTMKVRNDDNRIAICSLLRENLERIGIICNIKPLEATTLQKELLDKDYDACFGGWATGADPDTAENIWGTGELRNFGSYSNPEVDRLFKEARLEFDRDKRGEMYGRIHELIYADQPYTFLYFQRAFYGFNKSLRGYFFSPRGPYHYGPGFSAIWKGLN